MTRGRYFATLMPIWAVLYGAGLLVFENHTFTVVGALVFAVIALVGATIYRDDKSVGRDRSGRAARRAARRT